MYLDANSLYGWVMTQYLPVGGFRWVKPGDFDETSLMMLDRVYIFEVDLEYQKTPGLT